MEEYKKCFENYEISNLGNCRRLLKTGKYKKVNGFKYGKKGNDYIAFNIRRNGKLKSYPFHCLVAEQFIGPRPQGLIIDHIDRNRFNNNVNNLRYTDLRTNRINANATGGIFRVTRKRKYANGTPYTDQIWKASIQFNEKSYSKTSKNDIEGLKKWLQEKRNEWNK